MKLVSACLLGIKCNWKGKDYKSDKVIRILKNEILVPVCPEQLGGLPTPRAANEIANGEGEEVLNNKCRVLNLNNEDVTENFIRGAKETLRIARLFNIKEFIGKSGSPSCGEDGVTAALLKRNGIKVVSENEREL